MGLMSLCTLSMYVVVGRRLSCRGEAGQGVGGRAGGGAAALPPVAVRRCRLVQPTRKLTTAAFDFVDPATYYAGVDLFGPYVTMERVAILACAGIATQLFLEARLDGLYVDAQFAACRSTCGFVEWLN